MKKTISVTGMKCPHCEKHMSDALLKIDGVASAVSDHNACTAVVELTKEVSDETLKQAVVACGYQFGGVK